MEWVETTGRTVEEAKDAALDQLGVDEAETEFEVIEEPKSGLFGRLRQEARVRARVAPTQPRPKVERRRGRPKRGREAGEKGPEDAERPSNRSRPASGGGGRRKEQRVSDSGAGEGQGGVRGEALDLDGQRDLVLSFLDGLTKAFAVDAEVTVEEVDGELEARIDGSDLGLLVGPKGQTLTAVQELTRTVVQRHADGDGARLRVDIAGYRERRRQALERFANQVAAQVVEGGEPVAMEPMSPPDRKVVHDTVNAIDGVRTVSEGAEPRRRVVIHPD